LGDGCGHLRSFPESGSAARGSLLHVWSVPLDLDDLSIEACRRYLPQDEPNTPTALWARDRDRYTVAHAGLHLLVVRYTQTDAGVLRLVWRTERKAHPGRKQIRHFVQSHAFR
jgi:hypothetical protein